METEIESYLCKSVLVQKGLPKPLIHQRERSQGGAAMCRREEAGQLHSGGCRVGLQVARVSALCTKRGFPASEELLEGSIRLTPLVLRVMGDVTWRKRIVSSTGEVLRCLCFLEKRQSIRHRPKRLAYATERRRYP
jgi:hypothetical protein